MQPPRYQGGIWALPHLLGSLRHLREAGEDTLKVEMPVDVPILGEEEKGRERGPPPHSKSSFSAGPGQGGARAGRDPGGALRKHRPVSPAQARPRPRPRPIPEGLARRAEATPHLEKRVVGAETEAAGDEGEGRQGGGRGRRRRGRRRGRALPQAAAQRGRQRQHRAGGRQEGSGGACAFPGG